MDWPSDRHVELLEGLSVGGGRGVFAKVDLRPGHLLLVESPLVTIPDDKAAEVGRVSHECVGSSSWVAVHHACHGCVTVLAPQLT